MNKRQAEFVAKVTREFPDMSPEQVVNACSDLIALSTEYYRLSEAAMNRPMLGWEVDTLDNVIPHEFGKDMFHFFYGACTIEYSTFYCVLVVPSGKSDFMGGAGFCIPPNQEEDEE